MKEPKIRFKGFKGEWENTPFSETFDSLKNNSLSRAELSDSGEVMNIHYGDVLIKYGECVDVIKEVETFVKDEEVAKKLHQSCAIKNGDVIFADAAEDNTVGKCSEVIANENDAIVSGLHTIACRPKKDFAPMYLGYYLNSNAYHDQLLPHIQGTKISSISKKAISQTHINSPLEKDEQQSIASFFQHLDSLIQSTTKKIESLKQVKAASLQSMFPQEGETTPRVRFKGFEGEWEKVLVGSLGTWSKGRLLSKSDLVDEGINPCIHYGELFVNYGEVINKVVSATNIETGCLSESGDILFPDSDVTPTGLARCSAIMLDGVILGGGINILRIGKNNYAPFVSYSINQEKEQIITRVTGTTVRHINAYALSEVIIKLPTDKEEQKRIAAYLQTLDRQITLQNQRLEKLKQIKAACLDKMFV